MKKRTKRISRVLAIIICLLIVLGCMPVLADLDPEPELPVAAVGKVDRVSKTVTGTMFDGREATISFDDLRDKFGLDLSTLPTYSIADFASEFSLSGSGLFETNLDAEYVFAANPLETENDYDNWYADFVVSVDKDIAKDSLGLAGYYLSWGVDVGFFAPQSIPAGFKIPLLNTVMTVLDWRYSAIRDMVGTFVCGAFNCSEENIGTKFTVELRLFNPDAFSSPDDICNFNTWEEGVNTHLISKVEYTFDKVNCINNNDTYYVYAGTALDGESIPEGFFYVDGNDALQESNGEKNVSCDTAYFKVKEETAPAVEPAVSPKVKEESNVNVPAGAEPGVADKVVETALEEITNNTAVRDEDASNIQEEEIGEALEKIIDKMITSSQQLKITVKSVESKTEETQVSEIEATTITTTSAKYDVKPWVTIEEDGEIVKTRVITNDELAEALKANPDFKITFRLAIPDSMAQDTVLVSHYPDGADKPDWTKECKVLGEEQNRFVELSATEFSVYEVKQINEETAIAQITDSGKTTYYGSLESAVKAVKNGGKIELLKDTDETILVDKEIEFTVVSKNDSKNKATIKAGDGLELKTTKNKDGSVKYSIAKANPSNPKTGDSNNMLLWVAMAIAAIALAGTCIVSLKKVNK